MSAKKRIIIVEKLYRFFILISIWLCGVAGQVPIWKYQIIYIGVYEGDFAQWEKMS
ncbi:MAG: hypothetical protein ACYS5F_15440 [Planctomycetota bacterium]